MYTIRYATEADKEFWFMFDKSLDESALEYRFRNRMCYVFQEQDQKLGMLRYSLFRDHTPFCELLQVDDSFHHRGCGRALLQYWERDMKQRGYSRVMTSSKAEDSIRFFFRHFGYRDAGGVLLDLPDSDQSMEILMIKAI